MNPTSPTFTLADGTADAFSGSSHSDLIAVADTHLWMGARTDDPVHEAQRYAFVHRVHTVYDPNSWLLSFTVCPGDATAYRLVVGYDRQRFDAPWLISVQPSGSSWVNVPVHDRVAESPHVGYVVSHWPSVNPTPGLLMAVAFAAEVLARRAEVLAEHDERTARLRDHLVTMATATITEAELRQIMGTIGNHPDPDTEVADAQRLITGEGR